MSKKGHGIVLVGRNEEQPADKQRAQDPSSELLDNQQNSDGLETPREMSGRPGTS